VTEADWNACTTPQPRLDWLRARGLLSDRKARLFAFACCRRLWGLLSDEGHRVIEAVERHADGLTGRDDVDAVRRAFTARLGVASGPASPSLAHAAGLYLLADAGPDPAGYALGLSPWAAQAGGDQAAELAAQADILRRLFGSPPFRAVAIRPGWRSFGDGVVPKLARGVQDGGRSTVCRSSRTPSKRPAVRTPRCWVTCGGRGRTHAAATSSTPCSA
jgi:hypothetical protein